MAVTATPQHHDTPPTVKAPSSVLSPNPHAADAAALSAVSAKWNVVSGYDGCACVRSAAANNTMVERTTRHDRIRGHVAPAHIPRAHVGNGTWVMDGTCSSCAPPLPSTCSLP